MRKVYEYGPIIRAKRQEKHMKAKDLASDLSITPAFLSLIESNQRKPDGDTLLKIQEILEIETEDLKKKVNPDLVNKTQEIVKIPSIEKFDIRPEEAEEIVRINPKIAEALIKLGKENIELRGENIEKKSVEEIFPGEQVSDFIQKFENYFPKLEEFATKTYEKIKMNNKARYLSICEYLKEKHKILVKDIIPPEKKPFSKIYYPEKKEFYLSDLLALETRKLFVAALVAQLEADDIIEEYLDHFSFEKEVGRKVSKVALLNYTGAAIIMPYENFYNEVTKYRYDLELLQNSFAVSFEQVCHRVTCLQDPKKRGIPLHMIRVDRSGTVSKRFSLSGIELPRLSGACPKWNVYSAFSNPGKITAAVSRMADSGEKYVCIARTVEKGISKYGEEKGLLSIGLGCQIKHAKDFVYADGLNLKDEKNESKIGVSCRKCNLIDCSQRAFPPETRGYNININQRGVSIFVNE